MSSLRLFGQELIELVRWVQLTVQLIIPSGGCCSRCYQVSGSWEPGAENRVRFDSHEVELGPDDPRFEIDIEGTWCPYAMRPGWLCIQI